MTYEDIKNNEEVQALLKKGNANLRVMGYTDHSAAHTSLVAERGAMILKTLGYDEHDQELVKIAGFMHDIGNSVNRDNHAEYGGLLAFSILRETDMTLEDRLTIMSAISNHDETTGRALEPISAALIIADKTDVRRNRVCEDESSFDIYDRVNYAVTGTELLVDPEKMEIILELQIDENICTMYEYFEISLGRMMMSRNAASVLGATFVLRVNGVKIL